MICARKLYTNFADNNRNKKIQRFEAFYDF